MAALQVTMCFLATTMVEQNLQGTVPFMLSGAHKRCEAAPLCGTYELLVLPMAAVLAMVVSMLPAASVLGRVVSMLLVASALVMLDPMSLVVSVQGRVDSHVAGSQCAGQG